MLSESKEDAEAAFAELYSRHSQRVYAYCLRMTGSSDEANDIFQETFISLFKTAETRNITIENVSSYLIRIARNIYLNYKRSKTEMLNIENFELQANETGYEEKELLEIIAKSLDLLDFDYREVFILRQYHGLSYQEIAEISEVSVEVVRNKFWKAKEKIKAILAPYLKELETNNNKV